MKYLIPVLMLGALCLGACKKKGCTDSTATNYNAKADRDDGSCSYDLPEAGTYALHALKFQTSPPMPWAMDVYDTFYVKGAPGGQLRVSGFMHCTGEFGLKRQVTDSGDYWNMTENTCNLLRWHCYYEGGVPPPGTLWAQFAISGTDGIEYGYSGQLTKIE